MAKYCMKVLLFAEAREVAEADFIEIEISSKSSRSEIFSSLSSKIHELESVLKSSQLAQNHEYVSDEDCFEISASDWPRQPVHKKKQADGQVFYS